MCQLPAVTHKASDLLDHPSRDGFYSAFPHPIPCSPFPCPPFLYTISHTGPLQNPYKIPSFPCASSLLSILCCCCCSWCCWEPTKLTQLTPVGLWVAQEPALLINNIITVSWLGQCNSSLAWQASFSTSFITNLYRTQGLSKWDPDDPFSSLPAPKQTMVCRETTVFQVTLYWFWF